MIARLCVLSLLSVIAGCANPSAKSVPARATPFDEAHTAIAEAASGAKVSYLKFQTPCFSCRKASLRPDDVLPEGVIKPLNSRESEQLKVLFVERTSYIAELSKPCPPIAPEGAFLMENNTHRVLLLLFPHCKTLRVITDDRMNYNILNIDPRFEELVSILRGAAL